VVEIRDFLRHYREQRGTFALIAALSLVSVGFEVVLLVVLVPLAQTISGVTDATISLGPVDLSGRTSGELLLVALTAIVVVTAVQLAAVWLAARAAAEWQHDWRHRVFRAFLDADWETQSHDRDGKLVAITGINIYQGAAGLTSIATGLTAVMGLVIMNATAIVVAPIGAVLMLVCGSVLFACLYPLTRYSKRRFERMAAFNLEVSNDLSEYASLAREVRIHGVTDHVDAVVADQLQRHEDLRRRATVLVSLGSPLYRLGGVVLVLGLIWFATTRDAAGAVAFSTAALLLYRSVGYGQALQRSYHSVHETLPFLRNTDAELELYASHRHVSGAVELDPPSSVEFRAVSYAYDDAGPALDDVSVTMRRGEIIGLAGRSGAGKTTLAQILLRLRRPTTGSVLVDGRSADEFTDRSWAAQVALVPQDTRLIHGTVAENIAFLRDGISRAAIEQAAVEAGIHESITGLPDGYDTPIGPSTRNLSGGQIQRVGIARALAGDPGILVLDEPTSALDAQSEQVIQETLEQLRGRLLVVIIAHRLTTLSICSRVLVLEKGRLAAEGPPDEVLHDGTLLSVVSDDGPRLDARPITGEKTAS